MRLISLIIILLLISCDPDSINKKGFGMKRDDLPDQTYQNYITIETEMGKRKFRLWTMIFELYSQKKEVFCKDSMMITFYDSEPDTVSSILRSHDGFWEQRTNNLMAVNNVSLKSVDGKSLYTDTLYYDDRNKKFYSECDVMFVTLTDTLYGTAFKSDINLDNIEIENASGVSNRALKQ
ncbi:MAG: LPS export ABC transporter periplasmic protein LptC [Calditrichaeota bacterium]|nr:LPS export ABC transporter periplasmic protein LptC [Calditrichota bacterium]